VKVLTDDFGAAKLLDSDRERLTAAGVDLQFYNPVHLRQWLGNMLRDHRKLLIVDGEVAFVSGTGITDEFDNPKKPARSWRETAVRVSGPVLVDWQELFMRAWNRHAAQDLMLPAPVPRTELADMRGRVATASPLQAQDIRRSLFRRVHDAKQRVWLATAYFVPSRKLLRALKRTAQQGVDVRLLLPGSHTDHPRSVTPGGVSTARCCVTACASSNTSRASCTPRPCSAINGCRSAPAISTAGICAGIWRQIRKWTTRASPRACAP